MATIRTVTTNTDTIQSSDNGNFVIYIPSSPNPVTVTLPQLGAAGQFLSGFVTTIGRDGSGRGIILLPSSSSFSIGCSQAGQEFSLSNSAQLVSDGSDWHVVLDS